MSLTNLASSWAAFTVHAALFLKPGGRLGLVLPAELLSVNYAAELRRYLMQRFGRVRLVMFTQRIFPGVLEEVVLLLAEGQGPTDHCELLQVDDVDDLFSIDGGRETTWTPASTQGKWTSALLPPAAADRLPIGHRGPGVRHSGELGRHHVRHGDRQQPLLHPEPRGCRGAADPGRRAAADLPAGQSAPARVVVHARDAKQRLGIAARPPCCSDRRANPAGRRPGYIADGRAQQFDQTYKCRVRTPWWRVPLVAPADLLLTYMNADTPRLTTNAAGVRHLNSVHGVYLRDGVRQLGRRLLPLASLNSVTLLGAETVGRAYGGGMLKVEPSEADALPMPSPEQVAGATDALLSIRDRVTAHLREGRLMDAVRLVDDVLLVRSMGVPRGEVSLLEQAQAMLTARRRARGSRPAEFKTASPPAAASRSSPIGPTVTARQ